MKIGILASEGSWYFRDLQRAAVVSGHDCQRLDFERQVARVGRADNSICVNPSPVEGVSALPPTNLESLDVIIVRTMPPGSLEQVVYRMDVLGRLEAAGRRVVNSPKSLECAVDKYLTTARLHAVGLPVP